jgi:hypothetical protein
MTIEMPASDENGLISKTVHPESGSNIHLYDAKKLGITGLFDSENFYIRCDDHGYSTYRTTQAAAERAVENPDRWCTRCDRSIVKNRYGNRAIRDTPKAKGWEKEADEMDALDRKGQELIAKHGIIFRHSTDGSKHRAPRIAEVTAYDGDGYRIGSHSWHLNTGETDLLAVDSAFKGTALTHLLLKHTVDFNSSLNGAPLRGSSTLTPDSMRLMRTYFGTPEDRDDIIPTMNPGDVVLSPSASQKRWLDEYRSKCPHCGGTGAVITPKSDIEKAISHNTDPVLAAHIRKQASIDPPPAVCRKCNGTGRSNWQGPMASHNYPPQ